VEAVESDEELVVRLERALLTAEVRGDPAAVAALLHPAWEEVGRSGRRWSREEALASIGPLNERVGLEVLSIDRVGDTLLLLWRAVRAGGDATVRSSLWVRDGERWLQSFHQGTPEA
jgi:ribonuclease HI